MSSNLLHLPEHVDIECGVYIIKNTETGNFYIGSSHNYSSRIHQHISELRAGTHKATRMQEEYNELNNKSSFVYGMFLFCEKENRKAYERACIKQMKPLFNTMYNAKNLKERGVKSEKRNRRSDPFSRESLKPWEDLGISRSAWYLEQRLERLLNKKLEERISSKPLPKAAPKPAPEPEPDSDDEWWSTKT